MSFSIDDYNMKLEGIEYVLSHVTSELEPQFSWMLASSNTLCKVQLNLDKQVTASRSHAFKLFTATPIYLIKNYSRLLFFFIELIIYRSMRGKSKKISLDPNQSLTVFETFLMTDRIVFNDYSDAFTKNFTLPNGQRSILFGSVFGGRVIGARERVWAALKASKEKSAITQYDILKLSDVARCALLIPKFYIMCFYIFRSIRQFERIHSVPAGFLLDRLTQEVTENKVDCLMRYATGQRLAALLSINSLISWSENQPWHRVFFAGCFSEGLSAGRVAAYEFFNSNHDALFTRYVDRYTSFEATPNTIFVKGEYWSKRSTHSRVFNIGCVREAHLYNVKKRVEARELPRIGIALPYSVQISKQMIDFGLELLDAGYIDVSFKIHPNNKRNKDITLTIPPDKIFVDTSERFFEGIDVLITEGSGLGLEFFALGGYVFIFGRPHYRHSMPFENFGDRWSFCLSVADVQEVIPPISNPVDGSLEYLFERPRCVNPLPMLCGEKSTCSPS